MSDRRYTSCAAGNTSRGSRRDGGACTGGPCRGCRPRQPAGRNIPRQARSKDRKSSQSSRSGTCTSTVWPRCTFPRERGSSRARPTRPQPEAPGRPRPPSWLPSPEARDCAASAPPTAAPARRAPRSPAHRLEGDRVLEHADGERQDNHSSKSTDTLDRSALAAANDGNHAVQTATRANHARTTLRITQRFPSFARNADAQASPSRRSADSPRRPQMLRLEELRVRFHADHPRSRGIRQAGWIKPVNHI
jgi:hypothetical protein